MEFISPMESNDDDDEKNNYQVENKNEILPPWLPIDKCTNHLPSRLSIDKGTNHFAIVAPYRQGH